MSKKPKPCDVTARSFMSRVTYHMTGGIKLTYDSKFTVEEIEVLIAKGLQSGKFIVSSLHKVKGVNFVNTDCIITITVEPIDGG